MERIWYENYPENLGKAFAAEEYNGFGFQSAGSGPPGTLVFATFYSGDGSEVDEVKVANQIKEDYQANTIRGVDFLGHQYLSLHYTEWEKIPLSLQWLLDHNYGFCLWNKLKSNFKPGETFSWGEAEFKSIQAFLNFLTMTLETKPRDLAWKCAYDIVSHHSWTKHWNWQTQYGKEFCVQLRRELHKKPLSLKTPRYVWPEVDNMCKKYKVLHRGLWSSYEPSFVTVDDFLIPSEEKKDEPVSMEEKKDEPVSMEEDITDCMICMVAPPNTMVLPCAHVVVCETCSARLEESNDRFTCVRCRRPITTILHDNKPDKIVQ